MHKTQFYYYAIYITVHIFNHDMIITIKFCGEKELFQPLTSTKSWSLISQLIHSNITVRYKVISSLDCSDDTAD